MRRILISVESRNTGLHRFPIISGVQVHDLVLHRDLSANASHLSRPTEMSENVQYGTFDRDEEENGLHMIPTLPQADFHTFGPDTGWFDLLAFQVAPVEPVIGGSALSDPRELPADGETNYFTLQNVISGIEHGRHHHEHHGPPTEYMSKVSTRGDPNDPRYTESLLGGDYATPSKVQEERRTEAPNNELSQIVQSQVSHSLTFSSLLLMKEGDP